MQITRGMGAALLLATLAACGSATDPLADLESSTEVADSQRPVCEQAMQGQQLPPTVRLIAATEASFVSVKTAMATRYGDAEVASLPSLPDDQPVTLCALDTSQAPSTPQVNRAVLAISDGSSWWASGALG